MKTQPTTIINALGTKVAFHLPDPQDHIQRIILAKGTFYEEQMLAEIGPLVPDDALIIDAGANIGNHTLFFAKVLGAKVLAFEPNPPTAKLLQTNVDLNGLSSQVDIHRVALGSGKGSGRISNERGHNTGMAQVVADAAGDVDIRSLDEIVGDRFVHMVKIDVEGMECEVLKGAMGLLERAHPPLIIEAATAAELSAIEALIRPLGYRKIKVFNDTPTYLFKAIPAAANQSGMINRIAPHLRARLPETREICAGMATVAGNELALRATVASLLCQVDRLFVYLNGYTDVPSFLTGNPKIVCHVDPEGTKYGDAGKFWGLDQVEDAIYISCDDDILYPPDMIERMVAELAQTDGQSAQAIHGSLLLQPLSDYYGESARAVFDFRQPLMRRRLLHVAGTAAFLFHTSIVKLILADFKLPNMADIWVAQYLQANGIPAYAVPRHKLWLHPIEVNRPSIYDQSRRKSDSFYNSSSKQDEVLTGMAPISLLQTCPESRPYVLEMEPGVDVAALLQGFETAERDPVLFVVCEERGPLLRRAIIRSGKNREVHLISRGEPLAGKLADLLLSCEGRLEAMKFSSGGQTRRFAIDDVNAWIARTFTAKAA